jgi:hypothetical protein
MEARGLAPREEEVLRIIQSGHGEPVTYSTIASSVFGVVDVYTIGNSRVLVSRLRRKGIALKSTPKGLIFTDHAHIAVCLICGTNLDMTS